MYRKILFVPAAALLVSAQSCGTTKTASVQTKAAATSQAAATAKKNDGITMKTLQGVYNGTVVSYGVQDGRKYQDGIAVVTVTGNKLRIQGINRHADGIYPAKYNAAAGTLDVQTSRATRSFKVSKVGGKVRLEITYVHPVAGGRWDWRTTIKAEK